MKSETGTSSDIVQDIALLLQDSGPEKAVVVDLITKAKRKYVAEHHSLAISQLKSASKYKNGKWKTHVYIDGVRKGVEFKTEDEIYEYLYAFYKKIENPITFSDVFEMLMASKEKELNRSYQTILDNRRFFKFLSPEIKKKPIEQITSSELKMWFKGCYMPTKPMEEGLRKMIQIVSQVFKYGIEKEICSSNPAQTIVFTTYAKDCRIDRKTEEERAFSDSELKRIREAALRDLKNPRAIMVLVAMSTGMRVGELPVLHKCDVDDKFIHVHRQQLRTTNSTPEIHYEVGYTKDERKHPHNGRFIPINQECREALEYAKSLPGESDYIFHNKDGSVILKGGYMEYLKRLCKKLGIETDHNHAFRVAFNNYLIELGFSAADRALILGHAVETNERHYSQSDRRRIDSIYDKMVSAK